MAVLAKTVRAVHTGRPIVVRPSLYANEAASVWMSSGRTTSFIVVQWTPRSTDHGALANHNFFLIYV